MSKKYTPITLELVEAYTQCVYKAFLLLQGNIEGSKHEYSKILEEHAAANLIRFAKSPEIQLKTIPVKNGDMPHVVKNEDLYADIDILLKKDSDSSKIHSPYEPYYAAGTYNVSKEQKLRLAFTGYVIGTSEQTRPASGFIVTVNGQKHRIHLKPLYPTIASNIDGLRKMINLRESDPPKLILNSHCPLCQFRDYCQQQAEKTDNLSLLGKMTPKLMRKYEKKGIFTINQLSYVFNPRKRRKKSVAVNTVFSFELQALALRTEKIYLHETPAIPTHPVELFLDIEGIPDQGFYYLIGLIVIHHNEVKTYSF